LHRTFQPLVFQDAHVAIAQRFCAGLGIEVVQVVVHAVVHAVAWMAAKFMEKNGEESRKTMENEGQIHGQMIENDGPIDETMIFGMDSPGWMTKKFFWVCRLKTLKKILKSNLSGSSFSQEKR
jgi:hypothetical protein